MPEPGVECLAVQGLEGASLVRTRGASEAVVRHAHRSLVISAVTAGERIVEASGQRLVSGPGSVLVVAPGVVHSCRATSLHARTLCLPSALAEQCNLIGHISVLADPAIHAHVLAAWDRLAGSQESTGKRAAALELLERVRSATPQQSAAAREGVPPDAVRKVRRMLERDPEEAEAGFLARTAGMSTWGLNRAFARAYGIPPHGFALLKRVERAKAMLAAGLPAAQVAAEAGFADQSHFSRRFRGVVGMTPGRYARAFRREEQDA